MSETLVIGTPTAKVREICALVAGRLHETPALGASDGELESWRAELLLEAQRPSRVVVAIWPDEQAAGPLVGLDPEAWRARCDTALVHWATALGAAGRICADGGAIVAVVESPAAGDAALWVPEHAVGEAAITLVRSVAHQEGARRVRANAVTTSLRLAETARSSPAAPLASFPGSLQNEVSGAVWMLLGEEAAGVTASVVPADCGASRR